MVKQGLQVSLLPVRVIQAEDIIYLLYFSFFRHPIMQHIYLSGFLF